MLYLLIICHDDAFAPGEALVAAIHEWDLEMDRRGIRLDGRPLRPPADAVTVRVRKGTAGPQRRSVLRHGGADGGLRASRVRRPRGGGRSGGHAPHGHRRTVEVRPVWGRAVRAGRGRRQAPAPAVTPLVGGGAVAGRSAAFVRARRACIALATALLLALAVVPAAGAHAPLGAGDNESLATATHIPIRPSRGRSTAGCTKAAARSTTDSSPSRDSASRSNCSPVRRETKTASRRAWW